MSSTSLSFPPVSRAIDVGFGYVKLTRSCIGPGYSCDTFSFPSVAPLAPLHRDLGAGVTQANEAVVVRAGGQDFLVGPDALNEAGGHFRRLLDDSFFESHQYMALYLGAMHYMNLPDGAVIDVLAVGLPTTHFGNQGLRDALRRKLTGEHVLPGTASRNTRSIEVQSVRIFPQVLGSLLEHAERTHRGAEFAQQTHLTIDVGFGTLLWMVSRGSQLMPSRSGGTLGGISSFLELIARAIDPRVAADPRVLQKIETALFTRHGPLAGTFRVDGRTYRVSDFDDRIRAAADEHLSTFGRALGPHSDIDSIYLTGGGAFLYEALLKQRFPEFTIAVDRTANQQFNNVRGYQMAAERFAASAARVPA